MQSPGLKSQAEASVAASGDPGAAGESAAAGDPEAAGEGSDPGDAKDNVPEVPEPQPARRKRRFLHHPFTEKDYQKRQASSEYAKIKEVEDKVLEFKKEGVKTYVISAGVLYGLGESIFNHHFERAWK